MFMDTFLGAKDLQAVYQISIKPDLFLLTK